MRPLVAKADSTWGRRNLRSEKHDEGCWLLDKNATHFRVAAFAFAQLYFRNVLTFLTRLHLGADLRDVLAHFDTVECAAKFQRMPYHYD